MFKENWSSHKLRKLNKQLPSICEKITPRTLKSMHQNSNNDKSKNKRCNPNKHKKYLKNQTKSEENGLNTRESMEAWKNLGHP